MNLNVLETMALVVGKDKPFAPFSAEAWKFAGQMTLMGIGMVFAVLAILWLVLSLFKVVFAGKSKKEPKPQKIAKAEPSAGSAAEASDDVLSAVLAAGIQAYQEDKERELVAVITAAVAAYRAEEGEAGSFRVVSFKRASGPRSWNRNK